MSLYTKEIPIYHQPRASFPPLHASLPRLPGPFPSRTSSGRLPVPIRRDEIVVALAFTSENGVGLARGRRCETKRHVMGGAPVSANGVFPAAALLFRPASRALRLPPACDLCWSPLDTPCIPCTCSCGAGARRWHPPGSPCTCSVCAGARRRLTPRSLCTLLWRWCLQMADPPQSLHVLLRHLCSQMAAPPQSLHRFRMRWCSQEAEFGAEPPQSLHSLLQRWCGQSLCFLLYAPQSLTKNPKP